MGLWAQNVGVSGSSLPRVVLDRAGAENFGVPEPMDGWTWATLDNLVDLGELDDLAAVAAEHAEAPALAFSVHDSDSVYVVGADNGGVRFRLVVNPEAWEDELPRQEVEEAAAWSSDHAALDPSPQEIADVLARQFVFGEEGLDVLLARMGLLPAEAAEGAEELGEAATDLDVWSSLETVPSPRERKLERGRWHATLAHGEVRGHLLAAEEATEHLFIDASADSPSISGLPVIGVSGYAIRAGEAIVFLGQMSTPEEVRDELTRQGIKLGSWAEVPDSVPHDLASTAEWLLTS